MSSGERGRYTLLLPESIPFVGLMFYSECIGQESEEIIAMHRGRDVDRPDHTAQRASRGIFLMMAFRWLESRGVPDEFGGFSQETEAKVRMDSAKVDIESKLKIQDISILL